MESFNDRLRDECLNETLFTSLAHPRFVLRGRCSPLRDGIGSVMMARFQRLRPTALPLSQVETLAEFEDN